MLYRNLVRPTSAHRLKELFDYTAEHPSHVRGPLGHASFIDFLMSCWLTYCITSDRKETFITMMSIRGRFRWYAPGGTGFIDQCSSVLSTSTMLISAATFAD